MAPRARITSPPPAPAAAPRARERLLEAADALFYREGITTVGIDRLLAEAGVAKATLYQAFGSKEALIRAYLERRQALRQARIEAVVARGTSPRAKILAIFAALGEIAAQPGYRGCAFVNASAEAAVQQAVQSVCDGARAWIRGVFTQLARAAGAQDPAALASQLMVLYDGAIIGARMDRTAAAVAPAQTVASQLLEAACPPAVPRR